MSVERREDTQLIAVGNDVEEASQEEVRTGKEAADGIALSCWTMVGAELRPAVPQVSRLNALAVALERKARPKGREKRARMGRILDERPS